MDKNTGFYMETKPKVLHREDKIITAFRDRAVYEDESGLHTERGMRVYGKDFFVRSFFPSEPKATPTNQLIKLIENEQVRIENTHKALIDKTTWDIVQDIRKHKRRRANMAEQNIFSGLVYCKDCGGTMVLHRAHTMDAIKNNFMCSTYKKKGKENCSAHYIRETQLAEIILDDLRRVTHYARQNEILFAKHITQKNGAEIRREIAQTERELASLKRRDTELTALFKRLYEDNVLGKIPNEVFRKLSDDYLAEQKEIQTTIPKKESSLERLKDSVSNVSAFIDKAKQYTEINELTAEILHLFIERIEVGERTEKWSRTAMQGINIHYRDIGLLDNVIEQPQEKDIPQAPIEVA